MLLVSVYLVRETAIVVPDCLLPSAEMQRRYPEARLHCTAIVDDGTPVVDAFALSGIPLCERRSLIS